MVWVHSLEITGIFVCVQKVSECLWYCLEVVRFFQKFRYKSSLPLIFEKSGGIHTVLSLVASAHLNGPCLFRFVEDQLTYSWQNLWITATMVMPVPDPSQYPGKLRAWISDSVSKPVNFVIIHKCIIFFVGWKQTANFAWRASFTDPRNKDGC